ncbi:MAG TPA: phenylacetate--CoA ligase [Oscillospiraceae bacterium]|nr:phenylacetate--CoA ligase [Oscillospiraceae bacterium]HRW56942.1 phenylacetate--CoA ligase [Oscillospiraceae bacterium]
MKHILCQVETASQDEIASIQGERLHDTVKRVYENVPFYRRKLDEMGITPEDIRTAEDVRKLPFTYKQDLRDNYPYGLFAVPTEELREIHASSGTTGKQTVVGYSEKDLKMWGTLTARALAAAGGTKEDFVHVAYGYGLFTGGLGLHYGAKELGATVIPVSSGNTNRQIQIIRDFGSTILCCTPSYALYMGETMREMGVSPEDIHLKAGIFGAEPWSENMRKSIEQLLGLEAFDIYGLSEVMGPGVSFECAEHSGLHVNEDHFIAEVINPDTGEVLPDGERGELVFTCITKEALPLIRYRTKDITALTHGTCACGRTFVRMEKPMGRTDDMLIIRGVNVFPSQIESVLLESRGVSPNYEIIVDRINNLDTLEVHVEFLPDVVVDMVKDIQKKEKELRAAIESTLGVSTKVVLVPPKSIERSTGKAKRVIDKRVI